MRVCCRDVMRPRLPTALLSRCFVCVRAGLHNVSLVNQCKSATAILLSLFPSPEQRMRTGKKAISFIYFPLSPHRPLPGHSPPFPCNLPVSLQFRCTSLSVKLCSCRFQHQVAPALARRGGALCGSGCDATTRKCARLRNMASANELPVKQRYFNRFFFF